MRLKEVNEISEKLGMVSPAAFARYQSMDEKHVEDVIKTCKKNRDEATDLRERFLFEYDIEWWKWRLILGRRRQRKGKMPCQKTGHS